MKKLLGQKKKNRVGKKRSSETVTIEQKVPVTVVNKSSRVISIDILRALAIVLMILTHVTAIAFSFEGGKFLQYLSLAGGTLCFTFFLLLSGASNYFSYIKKTNPEEILHKKHGLFVRTIQILVAYYFVASFSMYSLKLGFFGKPSTEWIRDFLRIASFQRFPDFTEFIIPLFGFVFISIFTKKLLDYVTNRLAFTVILSVITYSLGSILYYLNFDYEPLNYIKGIFTGFSDLHLFPMLQYFGLFIFGIYIGKKLVSNVSTKTKYRDLGIVGLICLVFYAVSAVLTFSTNLDETIVLNASVYDGRFPPSASFLALGLSVFIFLLLTFEIVFKYENYFTSPVKKYSEYISRNALGFFVMHIVFILGAKVIIEDYQNRIFITGNPNIIFGISLLILLATTLFLIVKKYTVDAFFRWTPIDFDLTIFRFVMIAMFIFVSLFAINRELELIQQNKSEIDAGILGRQIQRTENDLWFNEEYVGRVEIAIDAEKIVNKDNWIYVELNHSEFLANGNSFFEDGKDLRVAKLNNKEFEELPILIVNPNSAVTKISFQISDNPDSRYFLYFGNQFPEEIKKVSGTTNQNLAEKGTLLDLELRPLRIKLGKNWYLKGFKDSAQYERMTFDFIENIPSNLEINYEILNIDNSIVNSGILNPKDVESKRLILDTSSLPVGQYFLQLNSVSINNSLEILQSKKYRFYTSFPLFVNWSIDWEGFGVNQTDLNSIANISQTYNTPITHYFNPVIFIPDVIAPNEATYYKNWVLERSRVNGDEIGLHNHLTPRLLEEVGVEVNEDARIVGIGRDETALSGYSYEELDKVIGWSVNKFEEVGLGLPKGYRAGAWQTSSALLKVLQDNGLKYDSSGRTGGYLTRIAGSTQIPWDLEPTTKPYRPNVNNINSSDSPNLNLIEFPNNGADSYWFSLDELKERFNLNYSKTMANPQVLTYLSHPHGFDYYDSAKIKDLFSYIQDFKFEKDSGPVIQTTLEKVYTDFNLSNF